MIEKNIFQHKHKLNLSMNHRITLFYKDNFILGANGADNTKFFKDFAVGVGMKFAH